MKTPPDEAPLALGELLDAREARAHRQAAWRARHAVPLVSVTLVSPGAVKSGPFWFRVMRRALHALEAELARQGWPVLERQCHWVRTGPEALYAVRCEAVALKRALVVLEDHHPWGRLWDLDVIGENGPLSRRALGVASRPCLVCNRRAHACARSKRHSLSVLLAAIDRIVYETE